MGYHVLKGPSAGRTALRHAVLAHFGQQRLPKAPFEPDSVKERALVDRCIHSYIFINDLYRRRPLVEWHRLLFQTVFW